MREFFLLHTGCCIFFSSFNSLNKKEHTPNYKTKCLHQDCFPIWYILTISVKWEKSSNFFRKSFFCLFFSSYIFPRILSARQKQNNLLMGKIFVFIKHALFIGSNLFLNYFFPLIYYCSLLGYAFAQLKILCSVH